MKLLYATVIVAGFLGTAQLQVQKPLAQPELQVKPVTVQHFSDLSEPSDIQPALGFNLQQPTYNPQPAGVSGQLQPAARYGQLQHAVTDYQLQGEKLSVSQLKVQ